MKAFKLSTICCALLLACYSLPASAGCAKCGGGHGHEHTTVKKAACESCAIGKAGKTAWCDSCKAGYIDGKKVKCESCFMGKIGKNVWCDSCKAGYVGGKKTACQGCFKAKTEGSSCNKCS